MEEAGELAMRSLKEFVFTCVMVAGLSLAVSAQKDDQKKPPPKNPPPVINPRPKPPPDSNKPKRPGSSEAVILWLGLDPKG
jgi:hypothetical protein